MDQLKEIEHKVLNIKDKTFVNKVYAELKTIVSKAGVNESLHSYWEQIISREMCGLTNWTGTKGKASLQSFWLFNKLLPKVLGVDFENKQAMKDLGEKIVNAHDKVRHRLHAQVSRERTVERKNSIKVKAEDPIEGLV